MIPSSELYRKTKQIMFGKEEMNPYFKPLAEFINTEFNVKVINIDGYVNAKGKNTLDICFEFEREKRSFDEDPNRPFCDYDKQKQRIIAEKFVQLADNKNYNAENIWVIYSDFESSAKWEANERISKEELAKLKKQLDNKDVFRILRDGQTVTFFLYTYKQLRFYENSTLRKEWADKYFDILTTYDEFGYFKRDTFDINLKCKKDIDKMYGSDWWYFNK